MIGLMPATPCEWTLFWFAIAAVLVGLGAAVLLVRELRR